MIFPTKVTLPLICLILTFLSTTGQTYFPTTADDHSQFFTRRELSDKSDSHTLIFAIRQHNLTALELELEKRSDVNNDLYGRWLSKTDVERMIDCEKGYNAVIDWLGMHGLHAKIDDSLSHIGMVNILLFSLHPIQY